MAASVDVTLTDLLAVITTSQPAVLLLTPYSLCEEISSNRYLRGHSWRRSRPRAARANDTSPAGQTTGRKPKRHMAASVAQHRPASGLLSPRGSQSHAPHGDQPRGRCAAPTEQSHTSHVRTMDAQTPARSRRARRPTNCTRCPTAARRACSAHLARSSHFCAQTRARARACRRARAHGSSGRRCLVRARAAALRPSHASAGALSSPRFRCAISTKSRASFGSTRRTERQSIPVSNSIRCYTVHCTVLSAGRYQSRVTGAVSRCMQSDTRVCGHNSAPGDRIAQLVFEQRITPSLTMTQNTLVATTRGSSGFGSTGME